MKPVTRFLILAVNSALGACASQAPTASAPPTANVDASQALTAAPATTATPATAAAQSQQPFTIPYGYRHKVVNGQDEYCRTDASTGSRTERVEVCYSRADLEAIKSGSNDTQTQQAHETAGAKVYSAPTQQQGPSTPN